MSESPKYRLFIAAPVRDSSIVKEVERVQQALLRNEGPDPGWSLVRGCNLHLTLHFIGWVEDPLRLRIQQALGQVPWPKPFSLSLLPQVRGFPKDEAAVVHVLEGLPSEPLLKIHRVLGEELAHLGVSLDPRAYVPHITVARSKRPVSINKNIVNTSTCLIIDRFELFSSERDSTGPYYRTLQEFTLEARPEP